MQIRPTRVAAVNATPVIGEVAENMQSAAEWCEQAADAGVELLVFPEAWNTGQATARLGREAGLAIADIDPAAVRQARDAQRAWADRRPTLGSRRRTELGRPAVRLQTEPPNRYLGADAVIEADHHEVVALGKQLRDPQASDAEFAKAAFGWVRDNIAHAYDAQDHRVTLTASQVLAEGVGLCYAKANLLAAILRSQGIPTGLCYQRLSDPEEGHVLHGLIAIHLDGAWHRQDPRGNKAGIDAQFSLGAEQLAYVIDENKGERDYPRVYVSAADEVVNALQDADDILTCPLPSDLSTPHD